MLAMLLSALKLLFIACSKREDVRHPITNTNYLNLIPGNEASYMLVSIIAYLLFEASPGLSVVDRKDRSSAEQKPVDYPPVNLLAVALSMCQKW